MSTEKIYDAVLKVLHNYQPENAFDHLDVGAGSGDLIKRLREHFNVRSRACDYTDDGLMNLSDQAVDIVNLNCEKLPYAEESFDIVTATEVIEHLEDYRKLLREIYRVLKSGGICIISTPNILNINSRLRYLWFGFAELFGPLTIGNRKPETCASHINPVSYFYLHHALREINFSPVSLTVDKYQKSGIFKAFLLWLPIKLMSLMIYRKEFTKYSSIDDTNDKLVKELNAFPILLGRTIIVSAIK